VAAGIDADPAGVLVQPRSVLHVVRSTKRRGAEVFGSDLSSALSQRGLASRVVALTGSDAEHPLPIPALGQRPLGLATLRELRQAGKAVDVVVAHGSRTLDACALALAGAGTPFVYRSIGDPAAWSAHGVRRWRTAALLGRAARVTVLWPGAADTLRRAHGVPSAKIDVVPNGVPVADHPVPGLADRVAARTDLGLPADAPVAVCIGALSAEKRVGAAIDAVAGLPEVHLLVVGDGPERPGLEDRAAATAPSRVRFTGVLPGPGAALAAADVVMLASRTEGIPGVLIEGGLAARPCVATDVGGVSAVVEDGVTGVLVPPDGRPEQQGEPGRPGRPGRSSSDHALGRALGEALAGLLARGASGLGDMGAAARARCAARFDMAAVTAQWAEVLDTVMDGVDSGARSA
jgi:glycosyltransferase involved in cell wall biosynthesis